MSPHSRLALCVVSGTVLLLLGSTAQPSPQTSTTRPMAANGGSQEDVTRFGEATIFVEYHVDEDAAEIILLASTDEKLARFRVTGPQGVIHRVVGHGQQGLGDLGFESSSMSLEELREEFPAGRYLLAARTVSGQRIHQVLELSHHLPAAPMILTPRPQDPPMDHREVNLRWLPMADLDLMVSVEKKDEEQDDDDDDGQDNDTEVIRVKIPKGRSNVDLPAAFLEPGSQYSVDLIAIDPQGNRSLTELEFTTR